MRPLTLFLLSISCLPAAVVADNPDVAGQERLFESWIRAQLAYRNLPGLVVGVVADQQLVWAKGFGFADVESRTPMTSATKFRMASHSKLFTATAIMQLRDQGKVRLDDPVAKYLDWFKVAPAETDDPPITIEELLTHSAGLPREAGAHWTEQEFPDAAGIRKYVLEHPAPYSPEVRFKYSNLGFTIAGMIVESVSGEKYADYVQKHIFDPLGMTSSSVDKNVPGIASGYGRQMPDGSRTKVHFVDARAMAPATGITSTVEDMAKFVSLQFRKGPVGGSQILSTGALREMHRVRMLESNWTRGNAIGFAVLRQDGKVYVGHGGVYFGYRTQTIMQMDDKVGVIVLTNCDDFKPAEIAMRLMNGVGDAVAKASAPKTDSIAWDPTWSRFAGLYRSQFGDTEVVELNRKLVMFDPANPNLETPINLIPLGGGRFRFDAPTGGGVVGEIVRFTEENGKVVRMYTGDSYTERVQ
ncbi:MAG TPA: serine hydrolase domain-containing protein [Bryobacteraceae bacterium]|nr:serine hydrolase domain-containing protein [Bryobacteraceae bacterium]